MSNIPKVDLPEIDVSQQNMVENWPKVVHQINEAFTTTGFLAITGHRITEEYMRRADRVVERLFALPKDQLTRYAHPEISFQRGYAPFGAEHAKDNPTGDLKYFWMTRDPEEPDDPAHNPFGGNIWPEEVPEFKGVALFLLAESLRVGRILLSALEIGHDVPKGTLVSQTKGAETMQRTIYYPPLDDFIGVGEESWRSAPHEDINLITVMPASNASGLHLKLRGEWVEPVAPRNRLIADTGEMIRIFKGFEGLTPTTHRVMNPEGEAARTSRISYPVFIHGVHTPEYREHFFKRIAEITGQPVI
ncbi:isopenicillin N synthase family oxygenase [Patescibacteria group bacterium]|nr:isopenicillin N synthase family oxygenase [Patescibacteria group bacterium]